MFSKSPEISEGDIGLWGRSFGLESQNVGATVDLKDHPACSADKEEQPGRVRATPCSSLAAAELD